MGGLLVNDRHAGIVRRSDAMVGWQLFGAGRWDRIRCRSVHQSWGHSVTKGIRLMMSSQPTVKTPVPMGRFPLAAAIVGITVHYVVADQFYGFALTFENGDPDAPIWLEDNTVSLISGAVAGGVAISSFVWAVITLRRFRIHGVRSGWIAVASAALLGLPLGVAAMIAFQESTTALLGSARFGIALVVGLLVGSVTAFLFNRWAYRRLTQSK
jgi:hypothetical protein